MKLYGIWKQKMLAFVVRKTAYVTSKDTFSLRFTHRCMLMLSYINYSSSQLLPCSHLRSYINSSNFFTHFRYVQNIVCLRVVYIKWRRAQLSRARTAAGWARWPAPPAPRLWTLCSGCYGSWISHVRILDEG